MKYYLLKVYLFCIHYSFVLSACHSSHAWFKKSHERQLSVEGKGMVTNATKGLLLSYQGCLIIPSFYNLGSLIILRPSYYRIHVHVCMLIVDKHINLLFFHNNLCHSNIECGCRLVELSELGVYPI